MSGAVGRHFLHGIVFVALSTLGAGCATSLQRDLETRPNGRFAESALGLVHAHAEQPVHSPPAPPVPDANSKSGSLASMPRADHGPVSARDLANVGIEVAAGQLETYRKESWRPQRRLGRSEAWTAFLARSPKLTAAVESFRGSFDRYQQVAYLNDLVRQYDAFASQLQTYATTPHVRPNISRRFPFGGVASLQGEIVNVDVSLARVRFEQAVLDALVSFEQSFQAALYWQRAVSILADNVELTRRVVDTARARYRAGTTSHANLIQAQIRLEDVKQQRKTARARHQAARTELAAILDLPAGDLGRSRLFVGTALPSRPERSSVRAAVRAHGPAPSSARLAVLRSTLMVQLAERQLLPNLSPGIGTSAGLDTPLPRADTPYATGGAFLRGLRHLESAARARHQGVLEEAPARADSAWVALDDALRAQRINSGAQTERAEQGVSVAERGYRAGTATFFDLDAAVQLRLRVALAARAATRDAFVSAARLQLTTGTGSRPASGLEPRLDEALHE